MTKAIIVLFTTTMILFNPVLPARTHAAIKGVKPSEACDLFTNSGLATSGWHIYYDYVCGCSSEHIHSLPAESSEGKLAYFVEGSCKSIRRIKLTVEIEDSLHEKRLIGQFKIAVKTMIEQIARQPVPQEVLTAIDEKNPIYLLIGETSVTVDRITWTRVNDSEVRKGYEMYVILE